MKKRSIPSGADLTALYREWSGDYPKFFKMDTLSKLGFLLSEMLLHDSPGRFRFREDCAVLVFSRNGSLADDRNYASTMEDYPSPSLFVYTLPNIVAGEIAIRNKWGGETSAYVLESYDLPLIRDLVGQAFEDGRTESAFVAWIDCRSDKEWTADGYLVNKTDML